MATLCKTSLTATAIRYTELSEDAVAVVVSTGQEVNFCRLSDPMKTLREITWLRKGSPVPKGTITAELNSDPAHISGADRTTGEIDITDWLGGIRSYDAIEEVIGLGSYGKTLTVLTCPSIIDETYRDDTEDKDDEDD